MSRLDVLWGRAAALLLRRDDVPIAVVAARPFEPPPGADTDATLPAIRRQDCAVWLAAARPAGAGQT